MTIMTSDGERFVSVGSSSIWNSLYSTLVYRVESFSKEYPEANNFFSTCSCESDAALKTANEIEALRIVLSTMTPDKAIYDIRHPETQPPWKNSISKSIVSCDKLYTTEDGQDLLIQLINLLQYAGQNKLTVTLT